MWGSWWKVVVFQTKEWMDLSERNTIIDESRLLLIEPNNGLKTSQILSMNHLLRYSLRRSRERPDFVTISTIPSGFVLVLVLNHSHVDTEDIAEKRCQLNAAFGLAGIDCGSSFHVVLLRMTNRVIGNRTTTFDIIQKMTENRVKQLNRGYARSTCNRHRWTLLNQREASLSKCERQHYETLLNADHHGWPWEGERKHALITDPISPLLFTWTTINEVVSSMAYSPKKTAHRQLVLEWQDAGDFLQHENTCNNVRKGSNSSRLAFWSLATTHP